MAKSRKRQLAEKKAKETEAKFFKYAIIATLLLLVVLFIFYQQTQ